MEIPKEYLKNSRDLAVAILSDFYDDNEPEKNLYEKTTVKDLSYWMESRLDRNTNQLEIVIHKLKKGGHIFLGSNQWEINQIPNGDLTANELLLVSVSKFLDAVIKF